MAKLIGVYLIEHTESGRRYVGWSSDVKRRVAQHFFACANRREPSRLHRAMAHHGADAFTVRVLDACSSVPEALAREAHWIRELGSKSPAGFNLTDGGDGVRGALVSEESRQRLSDSHRGKRDTAETRARKSEARRAYLAGPGGDKWRDRMAQLRGSKRTAETKAKQSLAATGRTLSAETRAKISETKRRANSHGG